MDYNIPLKIIETDKTPFLSYNPKDKVFTVTGVSVPDNAREFWEPIIKWVEGYVISDYSSGGITINISLDYFSIQSSVLLLKILKEFEKIKDKVIVNWYYQIGDTDMEEIGNDYKWMVKMEFNIIEINIDAV